MSIVVGKRNYSEKLSNILSNDFSKDSLLRKKMILNSQSSYSRNFHLEIDQNSLNENLKALQYYFPHTEEKELITVLEDCDNNLEIAIEILQKSVQAHLITSNIQPIQETIKKVQISKIAQKNQTINKEEKKQDNSIQEEDPNAQIKMQEAKALADEFLNRLQTVNLDDAPEFIANVLFELQNDTKKKDDETIKKLKYERSILINAFINRKHKLCVLENTKKELTETLAKKTKDIEGLKKINLQNELRIKSFEMEQDDIY